MNLNHNTNKQTGDQLTAAEWNNLAADVNELGAGGGSNSGSAAAIDTNGVVSVNSKGNTTISATKHVNIEPAYVANGGEGTYGDVQIKPGDDISLHAHHRAEGNRNEVSLKILTDDSNKDEIPAALKINSGDITITNKDCVNAFLLEIKDTYKKTPDYEFSNNPFANLVSGTVYIWDRDNTQIFSAINMGHEVNGAITLDMSQDLLSAGVGKTRVFKTTNNGTVKYYKFTRVSKDDSVTNVNFEDASGFGYLKVRAQSIDLRCEEHGGIALQPKGEDGDGNMNKIKFEHGGGDGLEFGTFNTEKTSIFTDEYRFNREGVWKMATRQTQASDKADANDDTTALKYVKQADDFYDVISQDDEQCTTKDIIKTAYAMNGGKDRHTKITNKGAIEIATNVTWTIHIDSDNGSSVNINTISDEIAALDSVSEGMIFNDGDFKVSGTSYVPDTTAIYTNGTQYFSFVEVAAPAIKIESGGELKLGGILDFGSSFNFGETDNGIEFQYKLTKKNAEKDCGVLKVVGVNNHATNDLTVEGVTIAPGQSATIAQCSVLDIIKLVNYMKNNNQGPWTVQSNP